MSVSEDDLQEFARLLIREVRDEAIRNCDRRLDPDASSLVALRWANATDAAGREAIRMAIPDIVDDVIFHFVNHGIDQGQLPLTFHASSGNSIDLEDAGYGELGGWFMTDWRQRYSEERFVDDFGVTET